MIAYTIKNISRAYADGHQLDDPHLDSIANIEADFELIVNGRSIIKESHWNIVEFAQQLNKWNNSNKEDSFIYECMDSDHADIFRLTQKEGVFYLLSGWTRADDEVLISDYDLNEFIKAYTESVKTKVNEVLGVDLEKVKGLGIK